VGHLAHSICYDRGSGIAPVTVSDTRVFPESISATSDGTLLIAGSEKDIMDID
jgi:hypothetical protein